MRKLAFSSNAFKKNTLAEAIDSISAIGYRGVELMADLHHAWPPTFDAARRRDAQKQLADLGLVVSNVNAFTCFVQGDTYHPTWIEDEARLVQLRVDHTIRSLEMAQEFGVTTLSIQPGGPTIGMPLSREQAEERFAESLSECVDTARRCGVVIAIEPEPGLLIQTAQEYLDFKNRYFPDEAAVRMNCDIGHLFCVGDDPAGVIRAMPGQIAHVHLEDIGANHVHQHLTPGKGVIDFAGIFAALDAVGYDRWVTVELYPYETTAAGVAEAAWEHLGTVVEL
ncbi:MAG: sugar phosphate isomerase/epimerase [Burkholderiales bacterium]|nr:sugar phosphate isomerase/epimerase [Phycisphaerae bacterium]